MKESCPQLRAPGKTVPRGSGPESREALMQVLEAAGDVFYQCGPEGSPMRFFGASPLWLGVKDGVMEGGRADWLERVHPEDVAEVAAMDAAAAEAGPQSLEYRCLSPEGDVVWLRETQCLVPDGSTGDAILTGVLKDVTEKRRAATRLRHYQKMRVFGELAGSVAHDFNNILALFQGYTELLQMETEEEARAEYLREMALAVERARELTSQLNRFSRFRAECPAVTDLVVLLRDCRRALRQLTEENIELVLNEKADAAWVKADPLDLEAMLLNLAANAREAMPLGGRLELEVGRAKSASAEQCYLMVRDSGEGIGEKDAKRIFEPGFTTHKRAGAEGLGLPVCQEIAKRFGGHISFKSQPGEGTEFRVVFPGIASPLAAAGGEKMPRGHGEEILIVEDDATVRKALAQMVTRLGYKACCVPDGNAALRMLENETKIRLVITDLVMPLMNGGELAEIIQSRWPHVPVILTSGYASVPLDRTPNIQHRFFLPKPVTLKSLAWHIRKLIDV